MFLSPSLSLSLSSFSFSLCVQAEMHTGYVLFQNDSLPTMLARIQGIVGPFPAHM